MVYLYMISQSVWVIALTIGILIWNNNPRIMQGIIDQAFIINLMPLMFDSMNEPCYNTTNTNAFVGQKDKRL